MNKPAFTYELLCQKCKHLHLSVLVKALLAGLSAFGQKVSAFDTLPLVNKV